MTPTPPTDDTNPTESDIVLRMIELEQKMARVGGMTVDTRWDSGAYALALRNKKTGYLPGGKLKMLAASVKTSTRELSDRMRVAAAYPTRTQWNKVSRGRSWTEIVRMLPKTREARTGSTRRPRNWRRALYEALGHTLAANLLGDPTMRSYAQKLYDHLDGEDEEQAETED